MDDYLAKPIEVTKMLAMLEKWLPREITPGEEQGECHLPDKG
jgi:DNA-binding response OmpR family regulator